MISSKTTDIWKKSVSTVNNLGDIECNYGISPTTKQINCQNKRVVYSYGLAKICCRWQGSKDLQFSSWFAMQRLLLQNFRTDFAVTLQQHWRTHTNVRPSEYQSHVHINGSGNISNLCRAGPSCTRLNLWCSTQSSILAFNIKHPRIQCKI